MKLKFRQIEKDGTGRISLIPEEPEDMWHLYNLIAEGDYVKSTTVRKVQSESSTGTASAERIRLTLELEVNKVEFDTQLGSLRVSGKNVTESQHIKIGAYHTLDIELNRECTITKPYWDLVSLTTIENATDPTKYADVGAVVMQEGLAHICLITSTMTIVRQKIEAAIPRKRKGSVAAHEKGLQKFFEQVMQASLRHFNFEVIKCVIIASPGFVKDQFFEYLMAEAQRQDIKVILENRQKIMLVHSSTGFKHSLKEVLADAAVVSKLENTKAMGEVKALNDFYDMMKVEPDRAVYGVRHVELANERGAIQVLLVTDELFRSADLKTRKRYVKLVESVKEAGGEIRIFSSMHVSGEQLAQISGIAAILRFPLPDLEEEEEDDPKDSNNNNNNNSAPRVD